MKKLFTLLALFLMLNAHAQTLYFPPNTGSTWDTISPASLGWCQDKIDTLLDYLDSRNTKAFIILKDGKIVVEHYFGTFTKDSAWYWASAGKSLTSFTVGMAQQNGFLSINDTTSKYLGTGWTACPTAKENMITIRNQLTMTSGLDDGVPDNACTIDTCLQYLADAGTRWAYHNAPYTLLDSVIYYSTGQTLNAFVTQRVLTPTGMSGLYLHNGYDNVFYSKPRSMARYGLLILNHGNWNGNQIMTDTGYFNQMVNTSQGLNLSYGYLWWLNGKASYRLPSLQLVFPGSLNPAAPDDMFAAMGKNGQLLNIVPSMNMVIVRMGNSPGGGGLISPTLNDTIWQKLNEVFCTANTIAPNAETNHLRLYPNPATDQLNITIDESLLGAQLTIYNLTGEVVQTVLLSTVNRQLSTASLTPGIYIAEINPPAGRAGTKDASIKKRWVKM